MKFCVEYFGCRSNQAEVQSWIIELENAGYELTPHAAEAAFGILNTCSVTEKAEKDVMRFLSRVYHHTRIPWLITGCTVSRIKAELQGRYGTYHFLDNAEKKELVARVQALFPVDHNVIYHSSFKSRIFLKVQDGCNFRCSFCIVPSLRGKSRSVPREEVVSQARYYASLGYREVVLTGINLSSYGYDIFPRETLGVLIGELKRIRDVEIIRLSSLDPRFIKYQFIKELSHERKIADSFHFSLQTGSESVLQRMNRGGKIADYHRILNYFRKFFPDANLGADIIVGFPGESEREFGETMEFVHSSPLNYLHLFPFSPRRGTKAALLETLPDEVVRRRMRELKEINQRRRLEFRERFRDRVLEAVLIEENETCSMVLTKNYLSVRIPPLPGYKKRKLKVRIRRIINDNLCEGDFVRR